MIAHWKGPVYRMERSISSDSRYESPNREAVIPSNTTSNCILSCHGSNPPPSSPTPPVHPPFSGLSSDTVLCPFSLFFAFFVTARKGRGKWPRVGGENYPWPKTCARLRTDALDVPSVKDPRAIISSQKTRPQADYRWY